MSNSQELLVEQIQKGNCVLFVGAGISTSEGGLPTDTQLADELAAKCGYHGFDKSLPKVAQHYEMVLERQSLLEYVCNRVDDPQYTPLRTHELIAQLPFKTIITTNYDILLEQALRATEKRFVKVVSDKEASFADDTKVTLFKIHGCAEQKESMVITEDDYWDFFVKRPTISTALQYYTAVKTLLFIGYGLDDDNFKQICMEVTRNLSKYRRKAYAVQKSTSEHDKMYWKEKGVEILQRDVTEFLEELGRVLREKARVVAPIEGQGTKRLHKRPYKFLASYDSQDSEIFFGRKEESRDLAQRILSHRLLVLFGQSGVGKTSLINAGVIPMLEREGYLAVCVRTLETPSQAIAKALQERLDMESSKETQSLHDFLKHVVDKANKTVIIFLDQFEEFFRLDDEIRAEFTRELAECYESDTLATRFVISLREDFFIRVNDFRAAIPTIMHPRPFELQKLTKESAALAITEPAERLGIEYETELVDELLNSLDRQGIEPPQLQIVCDKLFAHSPEIMCLTHQLTGCD